MLDAPVIFEGNLLGIICCEHKEEVKKWRTVDVLMVGIFSGLITIAWQNKILHEQQEKIAEQLQSLEKFNHHVSSKNEKLETDNLELSYELAKQNKILKEQNLKLSEYAQMNSHHLRAPLSSILSLVELSKNLKNYKNDEEWLGHLSSACAQLDGVVREMNKTLTNDVKLEYIFKEEPVSIVN